MTKALGWQEPGVEMVSPPVIRSAARMVVFSKESVDMRSMQASGVLCAAVRKLRIVVNSSVFCSIEVDGGLGDCEIVEAQLQIGSQLRNILSW